jgi:hypothetical protein
VREGVILYAKFVRRKAMLAKLICTSCGTDLSGPITIHSTKNRAFKAPKHLDQQPITSAGTAIKSWEPMQKTFDPANPAKLEFSPQFWMNPSDINDAIEHVDIPSRLNGCCGLDGCNGPNMRCRVCKTEVGTRQSDCWTPDVFIPQPEQTNWIRLES